MTDEKPQDMLQQSNLEKRNLQVQTSIQCEDVRGGLCQNQVFRRKNFL